MAWTDTEETRVHDIELAIGVIETALNNLATRRELQNLLALLNTQIDALTEMDETVYETQLQAVTDSLTTVQAALNNLATKREMKNILALLTAQLTELEEKVEQLQIEGGLTHSDLVGLDENDHPQYYTDATSPIVASGQNLTLNINPVDFEIIDGKLSLR